MMPLTEAQHAKDMAKWIVEVYDDPRLHAALLEALLRERGYEKRWAAWVRAPAQSPIIAPSEEEARNWAAGWNGRSWTEGTCEAVEIYVPRQGEGE